MDKTPRQKRSETEPPTPKNPLSKGQYIAQVTISPKKQLNFSLNYIPKQTNNQSPKKQQNVAIIDGLKSFPRSPKKTTQRYRPVAEDKIQTDIVNAIVARDTKASMKRNNAVPASTEHIGEQRGTSPSKNHRYPLSPKKLLPKGITKRQALPTNKKEFTNGAMSPRKPRKMLRKPLSLPKEKAPSQLSTLKPPASTEPPTEVTETKMKELKLSDHKDQIFDDVQHVECPKGNTEEEIVSHDLNVNNRKAEKSRRSIKPPGPLIKRSPFKNNPRFNKKQHCEISDQKTIEKDLKLEGKKR